MIRCFTKSDIQVYVFRTYTVKNIVKKCLQYELDTLEKMYLKFEDELQTSKDCKNPTIVEVIVGEVRMKKALEIIKTIDRDSLSRLHEITMFFDYDCEMQFYDRRYGATQTASSCFKMRPMTFDAKVRGL